MPIITILKVAGAHPKYAVVPGWCLLDQDGERKFSGVERICRLDEPGYRPHPFPYTWGDEIEALLICNKSILREAIGKPLPYSKDIGFFDNKREFWWPWANLALPGFLSGESTKLAPDPWREKRNASFAHLVN